MLQRLLSSRVYLNTNRSCSLFFPNLSYNEPKVNNSRQLEYQNPASQHQLVLYTVYDAIITLLSYIRTLNSASMSAPNRTHISPRIRYMNPLIICIRISTSTKNQNIKNFPVKNKILLIKPAYPSQRSTK